MLFSHFFKMTCQHLTFSNLSFIHGLFNPRAAARHNSAGKRCAVYIVCTRQSEVLIPTGTAFAVTEDLVVTSAHSVKVKGRKACETCMLFTIITISSKGVVYPNDGIPITSVKANEADDWAVFRRTDDKKFALFLEVEIKLPEPSSSLSFTIYHAPISVMEPGLLNSLVIWSEVTSLLQYDPKLVNKKGADTEFIERRYFVSTNGKCGGSSGAPIVNDDGRVIAFHTASFNEEQDLDLIEPKLTANNLKQSSADKTETRSNSQAMSAYASYSHATIISTVTDLMNLIKAPASNEIISTKIAAAYPDTKRQTRSSSK